MFPIQRLATPLINTWHSLPRGSVPVFLAVISASIARQITSDYRIRIAIVLGTAGVAALALLANKVNRFIPEPGIAMVQPERNEIPSPAPLELDSSLYVSLLPADLLSKIGGYVHYSTYQKWDTQRPLDSALHAIRQAYRGDAEVEACARKALAAAGVSFCPYYGESAVVNWKRYEAVIAPESRLFQDIAHPMKVKKMAFKGHSHIQKGPLLVVNEPRGCVAYHWPTGAVLWIRQDHTGQLDHIDLSTGQPHSQNRGSYFGNDRLDRLEIIDPHRLMYHNLNKEIHLTQYCRNIRFYQHPILVFENEEGIWLKNGDQPEILTEISAEDQHALRLYLVKEPYVVVSYHYAVNRKGGVYHLDDGKLIRNLPVQNTMIASIDHDKLFYVQYENGIYYEIGLSLKNEERSIRRLENFHTNYTRNQGLLHLSRQQPDRLTIYSPQRAHAHHPLEGVEGLRIEVVYNQYLLLSRGGGRETEYFVLDLAEQSLA